MTLSHLGEQLAKLEAQGLLRVPATAPATPAATNCSSNDYLGYAGSVSRETSWGAGASRLIHGTTDQHLRLESALADWVRLESALLFSSGYAANVGVLQALAQRGDLILSDALNHASIIDGCRLSKADVVIVPHLSLPDYATILAANRQRRCWVVTESYFSMDGDGPDLLALRRLTDDHGQAALIVDDAHAIGVFGAEGAGLCVQNGVEPDVLIGTLGKALGSSGAFVAGSATLRTYLWNRARSLVFSTATSPALAEATLKQVQRCRLDDLGRRTLLARAQQLIAALADAGIPLPQKHLLGPIIPVVLGSNAAALRAAAALADQGFLAQAIRPPTVPAGTARLRITLNPSLSESDVDRLAATLSSQWKLCSFSEPEPT